MAEIIISENGKDAHRVAPTPFGLEDKLQVYILDNPEAIPLYDISEDIKLLVLAREFQTNSGPIDALGIDSIGNIYIVETKLYKNADKRTVIAQALDYGASLWRHTSDFDEFLLQIEAKVQKQFKMTVEEKIKDFFGMEDPAATINGMRDNLNNGNLKFVILMDKLHDRLKDLILYVNQNSQFDIYAVQLTYYKHKTFEIIIPKIYGAEVKKEVVSKRGSPGKTEYTDVDESKFWTSVSEIVSSGKMDSIRRESLDKLTRLLKTVSDKTNGRIIYLQKQSPNRQVVALLLEDSDNKVSVVINSDLALEFYPWNKSGLQIDIIKELLDSLVQKNLLSRTEKNKAATQWFVNLSKDRAPDSEVEEFVRIYTQIINKNLNA